MRAAALIAKGVLLHHLAVQGEIETVALDFVGDPQADRHVDDLQDDQRDDRVIDDDRADADQLIDDLARVAFDQAGVAAVLVDREHAGQDRADDAADAVDAEAVERVVIAERVLEARSRRVAADAAGDADHHRADRADDSPKPA